MRRFLTLVVVLVIGIFLFVWFGFFNVAATEQHSDVTLALISIIRDRSISMRTRVSDSTPSLADAELIKKGFRSYHAMCVMCHSAPGRRATPIRRGLNPKLPKLDSQQVQHRSDAQLYWIIERGLRMTGMPAFGASHRPEQIWSVVAFLRELPKISPQQYTEMVQAAGLTEDLAVTEEAEHED
jgi:mono/diheme cytochrome c family protein